MVKWDFKNQKRGRHICQLLGDVVLITQKFILASMKLKQKYYVLNISYTNSEISIGRPYIQPTLQLTTRLHHCLSLERNLPTSILVRAMVSLLTFFTSINLAIMDLRIIIVHYQFPTAFLGDIFETNIFGSQKFCLPHVQTSQKQVTWIIC